MYRLFNNSLGVPIGTPFEDSRKCDGWEAAAPIVGDVLGALTNLHATEQTNDTNAYIATQTNKANQQINESQLAAARENWAREQANFEKQRQWSLEDRAYENEYNSPKKLMERYRQAGLNPYLMMDGQSSQASASGSTGQAPNFGSPPSPIPMQSGSPAIAPNLSGFGMGFSQAAQLALAKDMNEAQISRIKTQNDLDAARLAMDGSKIHWENKQMEANFKRIMQDVAFNRETWQPRKDAIVFANNLVKQNQMLAEQQTDALKFANSVAPEMNDLQKRVLSSEISQGAAMVAELNARTDLTYEEKKLVSEKISEQVLSNRDLPKRLHNDNAIKVATYNQIKNQAKLINQKYETELWITADTKKGYRMHVGNNRSLQDIIETEIKRNPLKKK